MKKFLVKFILFLSFLLTPCLIFAGTDQQSHRVLVVYYSREGHTKLVAEKLAEKFNADSEQLIDMKKRTGLIGVSSAGKDAVAGSLTSLEPLKNNPQDYSIILIGTSSWFGNVTPAVRTFIKENDLASKKIGLFGTAHLTGVENALKEAAELISRERPGDIPTLPLRHRDLNPETLLQKIDAFYKEVMKDSGAE